MPISFSECADRISRLHATLTALQEQTACLQVAALRSREWYQLLEQKLLPQLSDSAFLVAAVVGGTNIGKTVIFNHLAGARISATSPLASGTRHPVLLVPQGFDGTHDLATIFPGFELVPWTRSESALDESETSQLFWRESDSLPPNLLVLDTPDVDSDARINWERADRIRRSADVLIAVLTQQKYNDAAIKEFFRRAASENKLVIAVFNQVHLPDDEPIWPLWMKRFSDETGIQPRYLYLAPHDRRAAEENRLLFFQRTWPRPETDNAATAEPAESGEADTTGQQAGHRLNEDLATLHFGEIKLQTLRSPLQLLVQDDGVPSLLSDIRRRSDEYRTAAELLSTHKLAEIENWPAVPNAVIVQTIREWWQQQREGWSAAVHGFYNRIGEGLTWTYGKVRESLGRTPIPPMDSYREREWRSILDAIDEVYSRLDWFRELGNPLLQPRLEAILGAVSREQLISTIQAAHNQLDLTDSLRLLITDELDDFRHDSPEWYRSLRQLDAVAAAARPAASIVLFVTGFGPFGHAVGQLAAETAMTSAVSVAGDVAAGSVTAVVGETWISGTASTGVAWLEARFRRIHERFMQQRAAWLVELLREHLLGTLPEDLAGAAVIPESAAFRSVEQLVDELRTALTSERQETVQEPSLAEATEPSRGTDFSPHGSVRRTD